MLKLLDCNNFWSPSGGGVRRYHLEKIEYFKHRTDVSYVFVMHDDRTYTEQITPNICIEHLKVPKVLGNWEYRYLTHKSPIEPIIVKHDPDVIEVGSPYFMPRIVNSLVRNNDLKAKVFGFWHADFPVTYVARFLQDSPFGLEHWGEKKAWQFARKHYNQMHGTLVSSQNIMNRMEANGLKNLHYSPLGVNSALFHPNKQNQDLIKEIKAGEPKRLILFFGHRFSKEKGLHLLLSAYAQLCEKMKLTPALVIAGKGPYENLVLEAVNRFEHVHYKGFIANKEEMAQLYASADLGFALSAWETFGLSIVEALSAGLPLIGAGAGAAKEHIEKSKAGIVLDSLEVAPLVDAILSYNEYQPKSEWKKNARTYAQILSWKNSFDRQIQIYKKATTEHTPAIML